MHKAYEIYQIFGSFLLLKFRFEFFWGHENWIAWVRSQWNFFIPNSRMTTFGFCWDMLFLFLLYCIYLLLKLSHSLFKLFIGALSVHARSIQPPLDILKQLLPVHKGLGSRWKKPLNGLGGCQGPARFGQRVLIAGWGVRIWREWAVIGKECIYYWLQIAIPLLLKLTIFVLVRHFW